MRQKLIRRSQAARRNEGGFTLVELIGVLTVIAILLAIAIPTYLGIQTHAKDDSAQSSLRNSLTAAKSILVDGADFTKATPGELSTIEPGLTFVPLSTDPSTKPNEISVNTTANVYFAAARSDSGTCYFIEHDALGTHFAKALTADACTGDGATNTRAGWSDAW